MSSLFNESYMGRELVTQLLYGVSADDDLGYVFDDALLNLRLVVSAILLGDAGVLNAQNCGVVT